MRIIFFGTGKFAIPTLERLVSSRHEVVTIVTQPDRKQGRGWNVIPSPVKATAQGIAPAVDIMQPEDTKDKSFIHVLGRINTSVFVVVDYGQILNEEILSIPEKYCINLHPSLLPKYRGASPVNYAILNGDKETGNSVIRMTNRMDAGDIVLQEKTPIWDQEDATMLANRLALLGGDLVLKALDLIEGSEEDLQQQDEQKATYAPKLTKADGRVDWTRTSDEIILQLRALQPWPGAYTTVGGKILKILEANKKEDLDTSSVPGTVIDSRNFIIRTGDSFLEVTQVQLEGKKPMPSHEFLRGYDLKKGMELA